MKFFLLILLACWLAFAPGEHTQFVLDDYYCIVQNPLIKQPALYFKIFTSHLFDAYKPYGNIYYRPILELSYALDFHLFKLNPVGFQWINWCIHLINAWLVFVLIWMLFKDRWLSFLTAIFFVVLPAHEWVVRYITGRGDSLQALFGLLSLITLIRAFETKKIFYYVIMGLSLILSVLSREFGYLMPLFGWLCIYIYRQKERPVLPFALWWMAIGSLCLIVAGHLITKLGPIQSLHLCYFTSIGFCLAIAYLLLRSSIGRMFGGVLVVVLALISLFQGPFWIKEEVLLRHTHSLETKAYTICHQQLLMKYDEDVKAITEFIHQQKNPSIKSLWCWRLGQIAYLHGDLSHAGEYFEQSLKYNPTNINSLNARAVVYLQLGNDLEGLNLLNKAYQQDPNYIDTLNNLGTYYLAHKDPLLAQKFLAQAKYLAGYERT